ncbi:tRNA dimethylallyltransferase-like [Littorina saxatilis]|uniref:Uncharacterized protein n=1 Tax=Littorina saxatilis TaxID=31220 RepID=A0AAN9B960_9CAEN
MMAAVRRVPVVVILGATGTGKSKLSIELGQHFNGEIISADSMQMYKGLDIITNKVTKEEQAQCPHHLLSVLSPLSMNNTVQDFRTLALPIMENLLHENKMAIIVGGTNYYIEALLWNFLIDEQTVGLVQQSSTNTKPELQSCGMQENHAAAGPGKARSAYSSDTNAASERVLSSPESSESDSQNNEDESASLNAGSGAAASDSFSVSAEHSSTEDRERDGGKTSQVQSSEARREKEGKYAGMDIIHLHSLLQEVDPQSAERLHPKNRRKIVRALQVFDNYGVAMSKIHQAQHISGNTTGLSGALRYPHCCIFWLQSEQNVLYERLDKRVDDMLKNGLMSELHDLHKHYLDSIAAQNGSPDYTLGIFQSIGFKEFHQYLILPPEKRETEEGKALFQQGLEGLKLATRQYARKQLKWIKNRFLKRPGVHVPAVYSLDSTDPSQWSDNVLQPAVDIISALLDSREIPVSPMNPDTLPGTLHVHNVCEVCDGRVFTTLDQWQAHLGSRRHKKMQESKRRKEKAAGLAQPTPDKNESKCVQ